MSLEVIIKSAEQKFKQNLEDFFLKTWHNTVLISHDIDHHRRVWHYVKELLAETDGSYLLKDPIFAEKLIIAAYMHDIGMSVDPGIKHGMSGSLICRKFFIEKKLDGTKYESVISAIENHDNKEYIHSSPRGEILTILSVADDLDAFGHIGILRYLEIYLIRGVSPDKIGYTIRENARSRFMNFQDVFGNNPVLFEKHKQRFIILDNFFKSYNQELGGFNTSKVNQSGYFGLIEFFSEMMRGKGGLENIISVTQRSSIDPLIGDFLARLNKELNSFK